MAANATGRVVHFWVENLNPCDDTFTLSWTWAGAIVSCDGPGSVFVVANGAVGLDATCSTGSPQIGKVTLHATSQLFPGLWDEGYHAITVQDSTAPTSSTISINPAPHNGDYRDVTKCVADCFDATVSYTTPSYLSLDTPHSVTLLYRSSQARPPMGFVQVDATDTTSPAPDKMSMRLKRPDGTWVTFTNGSQELFYSSGAGTSRLAAQFDPGVVTGAYKYTVVARSWRGNAFQEATYPIRALILNEQASPFGSGWSIPGFQRLYVQSDASVVITEGDGSIGFFEINYCWTNCDFISPPGDFSTVTTIGTWPNTTGYTRKYPDGTYATFTSSGLLSSIRDRFGHTLAFHGYNASNLLVAITDSTGKADSLGYDANSKLRWIKDPGGRVDSITIDASGNLTRIKDAAGGLPFQGTFDANHRLTLRTDRRGGSWGIAYDFAGKLAADTAPQITANGQTLRPVAGYASFEKAVLIDPASGLGTSTNPAPRVIGSTILARVTNPRGFTTSYALDRFGAATRIEEPLGRTTAFLRDANSHVLRDSLPSGHITRYTWIRSNLTQIWDSATGRKVNYTYDNWNPNAIYNLLTLMSGDVDSLVNVLTSDGKAIDSSRVGGATVWQRYAHVPPFCNQLDQPTAHAVTCTYRHSSGFQNTDSVVTYGQPTTPRGKTVYQYDGHGQRVRTINPVGDTTWTQYDSLGRVKKVIGPLHDTTSYTYDSLYLTQVRDAKGQVHTVWPNALGWPDSTADPAGHKARFTYDLSGNLVTVVNRRGQTIAFTYDSLDQVRSRVVGTDTTRYFADPLGRYVAVANRESIDTLKADSAGRPMVEISCRVLVSGAAAQCFRDSSVYERRDLRTNLIVSAPGLWPPPTTLTTTYHYNANMLLDTLTNFVGEKQTFTYGGELRDSTRTFLAMNNLTFSYGHPPWLQGPSSLRLSDATYDRLLGLAYSYDTLNRVTKHHHGILATPDTVRSLLYSAGRLVKAADTSYTWSAAACSLGILGESCDYSRVQSKSAVGTPATFYYDSIGNRKDSPTQGYGVDAGNRLRRLGYVRMDYDLDGNLTRKRILNPSDTTKVFRTDSLFWSATGQLDSLHSRDSLGVLILRISWGYDGIGRQVRQSVPGNTTRFLWDGDNLTFKLDSLGLWVAFWTLYPGTQEPQSVTTTDCSSGSCSPFDNFYYVTDALHNAVALMRSNPYQLYNQFRYGPFGDSLAATGPAVNAGHLRYKGAYYDGYTGYYRMGVRYYDPGVGRFISEDPLGLAAGINPYTFAANDPVNGYDPGGTCFIACWIIGAFIDFIVETVLNDIFSSSPSLSPFSSPLQLGICSGGPNPPSPPGPTNPPVPVNVFSFTPGCAAAMVGGAIVIYEVYRWATRPPRPCSKLSSTQCVSVRRALVNLFTSSDAVCRNLGTEANERFLSGRFSFDPTLAGRYYARTGPLWRIALGVPRTMFGPAAFDPGELTNTIAHEQYHAESVFHIFESGANRVGYLCAGPL